MPVSPAERSGQPGEKRQGRDRVDRREERSKILANLDQQRRHRSYFLIHPSYFFLPWVRFSLTRTPEQARGKVGGVKSPCAYMEVVAFLTRRRFSGGGGEDGRDFLIHPS